MAKNNAIDSAVPELTIDPGASGDSFIQFDINGTGEFRIGVDDTDGDAFIIAQGSALGTSNTFRMSAAGERTMPLQPAFLAYNSADDSNVTGAGTVAQVEFDTEIYDQNDDYNTSTDTFTAPITGRYHFDFKGRLNDVAADMTALETYITTSNRTYYGTDLSAGAAMSATNFLSFQVNTDADMDAADTATVSVVVSNGSGDDADIDGSSTPITRWSGHLVC